MEQIQVVNNNGKYDCNIGITTEEWFELLKDPVITPPNTWKALLGFYNSPDHTSKCSDVNPDNPKATNPIIWKWAEKVQKHLKRFQVLGTDGNPSYWIIPMKGHKGSDGFYWTVRPELVKAIAKILQIQDSLFQEALRQYKQKLRDDPSYWEGSASEPNQRIAIAHFQDNWQNVDASEFASMFDEATAKAGNLLNSGNSLPRNMILVIAKHKPEEIKEMFQQLFENNDKFDLSDKESVLRVRKCIEDFIQEAKNLTPEIKNLEKPDQNNYQLYQDINTVSTYLWFRYPDRFYKYKPTVCSAIKQIFGFYQYDIKLNGSVDSLLEGFAMYDEIRAKLRKDAELVSLIISLIEESHFEYKDPEFRAATVDFCYFVSKFFQPSIQPSLEVTTVFDNPYQYIVGLLSYKKNVILQGAPGTGKTYSTAAIALGILGVDVDFNNHNEVMKQYKELSEQGRIFFTTFHQSMDYEDFVEGLKPEPITESEAVSESGQDSNSVSESAEEAPNHNSSERIVGINYICKQGIFKKACQAARVGPEFSNWLDDFLNSIVGFENKKEIPTITGRAKFYAWWNRGNKTIFVRPVLSTCEPADRFVAAPNIEKIKLQATDEEEGKEPNYTFYAQAIINYVCNEYGANTQNDGNNNVVLIIDEINRGNVSKIFGELVTLLEADKRDDGKQESGKHTISVILPYSKERFSVPSNVYIIGTMNTTDRSTGTLDYAIRRRFAFVTLPAEPNVVPEGIARDLFIDIKDFIKAHHPEDMDVNDLMVGHSYFMPDKEVPLSTEEQLKLKIKYEVAPLLREYCTDGLLTCSQKELEKRIESWEKLEITYKKDSNAASAAAASESETSQNNE